MEVASSGRSPSRQAARAMQTVICGLLVVGAVTRNVSVLVNAVMALLVTFLPAVLERDYRIPLGPGLTLWLTAAVMLHAVGMVGLYSTVGWWDHLTHTLSATVVAGVGYTVARVVDVHSDAVILPPRFTFVYVVLFTLAFGVLWEVLEFAVRLSAETIGLEPVLVQYGLADTLTDLVFDVVGALAVGLFGIRQLAGLVRAVVTRTLPSGADRT